MKDKNNIIYYLPNVAFLLYAIVPICDAKEWLWYVVQIYSASILILYFICMMRKSKQNKKEMLAFMLGTRLSNFFYAISGLTGIIVAIALDLQTNIIFWSVVTCTGAIEFFWSTKIKDKQK